MSRIGITVCTGAIFVALAGTISAQQLSLDPLGLGGEELASNTMSVQSADEPGQLMSVAVKTSRHAPSQDGEAINWLVVSLLFVGFTIGLVVTVSLTRSNPVPPIRLL